MTICLVEFVETFSVFIIFDEYSTFTPSFFLPNTDI